MELIISKVKKQNVTGLKEHANNPRVIDEYKLDVLKKSIEEFPKMLKLRPIIVDENNTILCGNMRHKAAMSLGMKTIYAVVIKGLTKARKEELLIKDNLNYGEWDDEQLEGLFSSEDLEKWTGDARIDYSFLDSFTDMDEELDDKAAKVVKSIGFHFPNKFYEMKEMENQLRKAGITVGDIVLERLRVIKSSYE
jgi:hypothetical protein